MRGAVFTSLAAVPFWLTAIFVSLTAAVAALIAGMLLLIVAGWRRYDDDCGYTDTIFGMPGSADEAQACMDDQFWAITEQLRARPGENVE